MKFTYLFIEIIFYYFYKIDFEILFDVLSVITKMSLSNPCQHIQAIFDKMEKADEEVADGKITEGQYMTRSEFFKNEFEMTTTCCCKKCIFCGDKCDKKKEEEESDSDDEIEVLPYGNFRIDEIENLTDEIKQDWNWKYGDGHITVFLEQTTPYQVWDTNTQDLFENVIWKHDWDRGLNSKKFKYIPPN